MREQEKRGWRGGSRGGSGYIGMVNCYSLLGTCGSMNGMQERKKTFEFLYHST